MRRTRVKMEESVHWAVSAVHPPGKTATVEPFEVEADALEHAARLLEAGAEVELSRVARTVEVVRLEKDGQADGD